MAPWLWRALQRECTAADHRRDCDGALLAVYCQHLAIFRLFGCASPLLTTSMCPPDQNGSRALLDLKAVGTPPDPPVTAWSRLAAFSRDAAWLL